MVPTFGMFDFLTVRVAGIEADDSERQAYLAEVHRESTQFGAYRNEMEAFADSALRVAMLYRF